MFAPWDIIHNEAIASARRVVELSPGAHTDDIRALLEEHDHPDTPADRVRELRGALPQKLADARRHFHAHRSRSR